MDEELQKAGQAVKEAQEALNKDSGAAGGDVLWNEHFVLSLSVGLFVFAVIVIGCATYLLYKGKRAWTLLRVFGVLSIIFLTVFVLVVGYSDKQLLPVIGLFGSLVGYLLGKTAIGDQAPPDSQPPDGIANRGEQVPPPKSEKSDNEGPTNAGENTPKANKASPETETKPTDEATSSQ
jgi:hypothetical protein